MADNDYRSYRSRDPVAPRSDADVPAWEPQDDPLAELARLIGQGDPMSEVERGGGHAAVLAHDDVASADGGDWAADDRYGARYEDQPEERYEERYDGRREPPRLADPYPQYRTVPTAQNSDYAPPVLPQAPRFMSTRNDAASYAVTPPRYWDEDQSVAPPPPGFPSPRDARYEYDEQDYAGPDAQYASEDDEDAPSGRRRGGLVVVAAVLGLAVLGTAGAFAYRAMFGGSMLPSLPPIIRADGGPTKIIPSANSQASNSGQANATGLDSGDKLVPREETPVVMPQPANAAPTPAPNTAPRVVSTIPIFPDPTPGPPSGLAPGAAPSAVGPWPAAPINASAPPPPALTAHAATPYPNGISNPQPLASVAPASSAVSGTKTIHTVSIRPDQMGSADASAAAPSAPPAVQTTQIAPTPRPVVPRPAKLPQAPAARADANAPLSIVPGQGEQVSAAPARVSPPAPARPMAMASAGTAAPAAAGGGYAVQVSSQRSEADAQTEFRVLQAKFPNQLGGRQPIVRRADLGDKGIYYRALVGPYASMEQAAQVCSSLKAAGGNCIVQRD